MQGGLSCLELKMEQQWLERVKKSVFPLSVEKGDIRKALHEWFYTGDCYDLEFGRDDCELCGHPDIRYQFQIKNRHTQNGLLIGSECITRFDIPAVDERGSNLSSGQTAQIVAKDRRKLINGAKERRMMLALIELKKRETDFDIEDFINYYAERGAFTPKQISTLFWRLEKNGIAYLASDFKLTIRRDREKNQLLALKDFQQAKILPCLSASQRKFLEGNQQL